MQPFWKNDLTVSYEVKHKFTIQPSYSTLKRNENICSPKDFYVNV